ncbi:hypothetical protein E1B28_002817 [Marasmius oreades]|uniref:Uncharacterized protein n=1 Tax=Marasmius oreades TaxID=181124 RepID=A0A9P7UM00_9AGAR|nr:uncharacterized protein E1B28_002817 [Marasmius oreades]KAG7086898.1 hypothetical protein E1B28_002817 [Marasmius oreades]
MKSLVVCNHDKGFRAAVMLDTCPTLLIHSGEENLGANADQPSRSESSQASSGVPFSSCWNKRGQIRQ